MAKEHADTLRSARGCLVDSRRELARGQIAGKTSRRFRRRSAAFSKRPSPAPSPRASAAR